MTHKVVKNISIDEIVKEKQIGFYRVLPKFMQSVIKLLLYENQINKLIKKFEYHKEIEFIDQIIRHLKLSFNSHYLEKLDINKRYIFVCNHPTGILDGLIILKALSSDFKPQIISNDIINYFSNVKKLLLPVNWFGKINKTQTTNLINALKSNKQIILFPAGEVSKLGFQGIKDKKWNPFFIKKAIKYNRDIVPVLISGKNSFWFYLLSTFRSLLKIKFHVEIFLLIHELFNKKDQIIHLKFGVPISHETLLNSNKNYDAERIQTLASSL